MRYPKALTWEGNNPRGVWRGYFCFANPMYRHTFATVQQVGALYFLLMRRRAGNWEEDTQKPYPNLEAAKAAVEEAYKAYLIDEVRQALESSQ